MEKILDSLIVFCDIGFIVFPPHDQLGCAEREGKFFYWPYPNTDVIATVVMKNRTVIKGPFHIQSLYIQVTKVSYFWFTLPNYYKGRLSMYLSQQTELHLLPFLQNETCALDYTSLFSLILGTTSYQSFRQKTPGFQPHSDCVSLDKSFPSRPVSSSAK